MMPDMSIRPNGGWIFYDGRCPLCRAGARKLGGLVTRLGFRLAPLQRAWVRKRLAMDEQELLRESRLLTADGRIIGGASMYVFMSRLVWWSWPVVAVASIPGGMKLLDWIYTRVARNRHCISSACRLDQRIHHGRKRGKRRGLTTLLEP